VTIDLRSRCASYGRVHEGHGVLCGRCERVREAERNATTAQRRAQQERQPWRGPPIADPALIAKRTCGVRQKTVGEVIAARRKKLPAVPHRHKTRQG
jgi:hypothetical protein